VPLDALDRIVKAYDIRGVYPDELDEEVAVRLGSAAARFFGSPEVLVGRDCRASSVPLAQAFMKGVNGEGVDVIDLGLAATDLLYFASGKLDRPGVMFTASHNPARYNGAKLCREGAAPVGADTGLDDIRRMIREGTSRTDGGGSVRQKDLLSEYGAHVRSFIDRDSLQPMKVVMDAANGMAGLVVPEVYGPLPIDVVPLFFELDGTFPNHPADPIQPENLVTLQERVLAEGADLGMAFDGDADRVFLVDDKAEPVSGSTTTALVARGMLRRNPGAKVIHNLICSKAVPEVIREAGGEPVRTRVGHSYIKAVMAETGAIFGGEHSGHYYFRDNYRADSGLIASLVVLEELSRVGRPLSEVRSDLERYAASGEINSEVTDQKAAMERVAATVAGAKDWEDGLTVDQGDWWFNLRPSNTEPLLRLNLEAPDEESMRRHLSDILELVRS
jgi:phosphomannomutase